MQRTPQPSGSTPGQPPSWAAFGVFGAGVALACLVAALAQYRSEAREREVFEEQSRTLTQAVERSFALPIESLRAVSAFRKVRPGMTADEFRAFASELMVHHASLAALEWAEVVEEPQRSSFEAAMSARLGHPFEIVEPDVDGRMMPARRRARYLPLVFLQPFVRDLEGFDATYEPAREKRFEDTLAGRKLSVSARFRLVEDPPGIFSISVYDPIFQPPPREDQPLGVSIALYRIDPLVRSALGSVAPGGLLFALLDEDAEPAERVLFVSHPGAEKPDRPRFVFSKEIQFVGRRWRVLFSSLPRPLPPFVWAILAVGVLASAALAWLVSVVQGQRRQEAALLAEHELGVYALTRKLGEGGMGEVFEATHKILRRRVAIKLILPELISKTTLARFNREASAMCRLTHPCTVTLYDYGVSLDGRFYLVMEFLDGITLEALIDRFGSVPLSRLRFLMLQVCEALAEAHDKNVIHRDIKPANIMLCRIGGKHDFIKLLDFGLAKLVRARGSKVSVSGVAVGTISYLAPECLRDPESASPRSDIYALGCVAYELLTGQEFSLDRQSCRTLLASLARPVATPDDPAGREAIARIIGKCIEEDPKNRYQSTLQLAHALSRVDLAPWGEADAADWWEAHLATSEIPPASLDTSLLLRVARRS